MSSIEAPRTAVSAASAERAVVSGWGRTSPAPVTVVRPLDSGEVATLLRGGAPARGLIPRGAGRSYGDAAQNRDGLVLDMSALDGVHSIDARGREVRAGAGTPLRTLLEALAERGLTLPVVPGTAHVSVGGAIAADIHGKNHPRDGSIARHVRAFTLCTPADGELEVTPESDPALFAATLGGMGLTGAITAATLSTILLREPCAVADIDTVETLEDAAELLGEEGAHSHAIAWVDLLARGSGFTRSVVTRSREGDATAAPGRLGIEPAHDGLLSRLPPALLRPSTVRAFNRWRWLRARRAREVPLGIGEALFPLDQVAGWNRLYGRHGLVQYQFAVPDGAEWALRCVVEMLRARGVPMYLATLKRLGRASGGMLSFPMRGWTMAIDIPARAPGLSETLDRADLLVISAGGRVYLAKDARMSPERLAAMYPDLPSFFEVRARVDPHETLRSDLSRRLGLTR